MARLDTSLTIEVALERATAEIGDAEKFLGSGVLVARDLVLTCAHVVAEAAALTVRIDGQRYAAATVLLLPDRRGEDPDWPFPDLALLALGSSAHTVPVPFGSSLPGTHTALIGGCYRIGLHRRLEPWTLRLSGAGRSGQYGRTLDDVIERGMSGGPVLDLSTATLCGIMKATTSRTHGEGGWFVPIEAIRQQLPDLAARNEVDSVHWWQQSEQYQNLALNLFGLPMKPLDPGVHRPPSRWLTADDRVVPYTAPPVFDELRQWCVDDPRPSLARLYYAPGGAGKTRLAVELAAYLRQRHGWLAGRLVDAAEPDLVQQALASPAPTLLVVDYAENDPDRVKLVVQEMTTYLGPRCRLLLLARVPELLWEGLHVRAAAAVAADVLDGPARRLDDLAASQSSVDLAVAAYRTFLNLLNGSLGTGDGAVPTTLLEKTQHVTDPLGIQAAALATALDTVHKVSGVAPADGIDHVLLHELRYWYAAARSIHPGLADADLKLILLVPTLFPVQSEDEAVRVLSFLPALHRLDDRATVARFADLLNRRYPSPDSYWAPLRPDRIGEALLRDLVPLNGAVASLAAVDGRYASALLETFARALQLHRRRQPMVDAADEALYDELTRVFTANPAAYLPAGVEIAGQVLWPERYLEILRKHLQEADLGTLDAVMDRVPSIAVEQPAFAIEVAKLTQAHYPSANLVERYAGSREGLARLERRATILGRLAHWLHAVGRYAEAATYQQEAFDLVNLLSRRLKRKDPTAARGWSALRSETGLKLGQLQLLAGDVPSALTTLDTVERRLPHVRSDDPVWAVTVRLALARVAEQANNPWLGYWAACQAEQDINGLEPEAGSETRREVSERLTSARLALRTGGPAAVAAQLALFVTKRQEQTSTRTGFASIAASRNLPEFATRIVLYGGLHTVDGFVARSEHKRLMAALTLERAFCESIENDPVSEEEWVARARRCEELAASRKDRKDYIASVAAHHDAVDAWQAAGPRHAPEARKASRARENAYRDLVSMRYLTID
ncbi:trypsin-like peptidase domain-containing protein [Plantactinospora sp. WMMB782]|uniref:trypsin-like peptidase domain-containing protein n=1 Tax=Plantactinospora sp. WMMB782 TaxID=3404121 RepID=UPI003B93072D